MEKKTKAAELFEKLKTGVLQVYSSEKWREVLNFQARFHHYSWNNMMLILMQCPHATYVAGYDQWQKMGRYVNQKGGIKILAPHHAMVKDEKTGEKRKVLAGFHQTTVFDISQTGGKDIPRLTSELTMDTPVLRAFYSTLRKISPVPVDEVVLQGDMKGRYRRDTDSIEIKKGMAALQKCKTLVHEMAHAMLHKNTNASRSMKEVEAEGTAYVVLSYFGFDTSEYSFNYVAGWNASEATAILKAGDTIQKTAFKIIGMIEKQREQQTVA